MDRIFHGVVAEVNSIEWIGATLIARVGVNRFDDIQHSGHWGKASIRVKNISLPFYGVCH